MRRTALAIAFAIFTTAGLSAQSDLRDRSFDTGWRFFRVDTPGAEDPAFDDSDWRVLDLPHDWSIEDLPPLEDSVTEVDAVTGAWRFRPGDDPAWKAADLDHSEWARVILPATWEDHSGYDGDQVHGWFRRRIELPSDPESGYVVLLLGKIDDADQAWLNGESIGATGSFPPEYRTAYGTERRYRVPASLIRGDGSDVLAVRVFDSTGDGGIYAAGTESVRVGPFDPAASAGGDKTGYVLGGTGWYRKRFRLDEVGRRVALRFDGVYMVADVWINGHHLGMRPHGYTSFEHELTPYLNPPGEENVVAVRVRNEGQNSRWYSGSGIYRHVWLTVTDPVHVPTWGVFVTTPEVSEEEALIKVAVEVRNATAARERVLVRTRVRDSEGRVVGTSEGDVHLARGETRTTERFVDVPGPRLWSPESPAMYPADVEIVVEGTTVDSVTTPFGIRTIEVDAEHGFRLNGEPMLLRGGNIHHGHGPLGAASIDRAEERRVELMKANGYNAIRSSHNPPAPALLRAADTLGMLVIDEAFDQWNEHKLDNTEDYSRFFEDWHERDIASMVRRDRNHPSVVMWSIGNEIPEQFRAPETQRALREAVLAHDPTRPITQAISTDWGEVRENWAELSDPAFLYLDVAGYNYLPELYEPDHARHPDRVILGTESFPKDALAYWQPVEEHPYVIGDFVWTAIDYLGESGLAHAVLSDQPNPFFMSWPWHNAWSGDLDIAGFKKPQSYYRDVLWHRSPIEILVHEPIPHGLSEVLSWWGWPNEERSWNWAGHEGEPLQVSVYSRCERVRLELNDVVVGERPVSEQTQLTATFAVPYEPGELRALCLDRGDVVAETTLETSGPATRLQLTADRPTITADRNDLAFVTVYVVDADGRRVPDAEIPVHFSVGGVGELVGQASGEPDDPASFEAPTCETFRGRCVAILRPTGGAGEITLHAEAEGLRSVPLTVRTR